MKAFLWRDTCFKDRAIKNIWKSIDFCAYLWYNNNNSKTHLCILRNYTRVKLLGSKTRSIRFLSKRWTTPEWNYSGLKPSGGIYCDRSRTTPEWNYSGLKPFKIIYSHCYWTTPEWNYSGLKHRSWSLLHWRWTTPEWNYSGLKPQPFPLSNWVENYTRVKLLGSKTLMFFDGLNNANYTRVKLLGSKTWQSDFEQCCGTTPEWNYSGLKLFAEFCYTVRELHPCKITRV